MTIAKEIELTNPYENLGAQLVKEVATKTNDVAGDGTTTATVLAQAMVREGLRNVTAGTNPAGLKRGIDPASTAVVRGADGQGDPVASHTEIAHVATISAQDATIGDLIAEAMERVGRDGVITVEDGSTLATELEVTEGMQFDKGYISPHFVTDAESQEAVLEDAVRPRHHAEDLRDRGAAAAAGEGRQGQQAAADHRRGRRGPGAVDAGGQRHPQDLQGRRGQGARLRRPAQGDAAGHRDPHRRRARRPRARATSSTRSASRCSARARRIVVDKDTTTIVDGGGEQSEVPARVEQLRKEIEASDSDWDKEKLNERLAKLAGGVAVIKVGAATEVEMKERKHRIEDAISATKAAVEEGIVPGGGAALVQVAPALDGDLGLTGDEATGVSIVRKALVEPLRWIAQNAGHDGYVVVGKVRDLEFGTRPRRRHRRIRRPGQGRHRRPGQGDPQRGRQRRVDRRPAAHDREPGRGEAGRPEPAAGGGHGHGHGHQHGPGF